MCDPELEAFTAHFPLGGEGRHNRVERQVRGHTRRTPKRKHFAVPPGARSLSYRCARRAATSPAHLQGTSKAALSANFIPIGSMPHAAVIAVAVKCCGIGQLTTSGRMRRV